MYLWGWKLFFLVSLLATVIFVPLSDWEKLWPVGLLAIVVIYLIDSVLIKLGAFKYSLGSSILSGIPFFYLLSGFNGGVLFVSLLPDSSMWQLPYILAAAVIFLFLEYIMVVLGYFHYLKWNPFKSYVLNIFGFIVVVWLAQWLRVLS